MTSENAWKYQCYGLQLHSAVVIYLHTRKSKKNKQEECQQRVSRHNLLVTCNRMLQERVKKQSTMKPRFMTPAVVVQLLAALWLCHFFRHRLQVVIVNCQHARHLLQIASALTLSSKTYQFRRVRGSKSRLVRCSFWTNKSNVYRGFHEGGCTAREYLALQYTILRRHSSNSRKRPLACATRIQWTITTHRDSRRMLPGFLKHQVSLFKSSKKWPSYVGWR